MEQNIMLTISLLASNRKDSLPKCLESLKPLLDNVSSELIVVDTGCDEELVEYIRLYTERIIKFTWCDDFAKARNEGLKRAKGQWFMYIDDDEWFDNVTEIIDFFNSDEKDKYDFGRYVVRNYHTLSGDTYSESVVGRIVKIYEGIHFVGRIHEYIPVNNVRIKQFLSYVHHYGYAYASEEKLDAHYERNTSLLYKELEENPTDGRVYAHLLQEFRSKNQHDLVLEYANKAIENVDDTVRENILVMCTVYASKIFVLTSMGEYEEAIQFGNDIIKTKPMSDLTRACLYSYMSLSYMMTSQYKSCIKVTDEYVRLKKYFEEHRDEYFIYLVSMLNDTFSDRGMGRALGAGVCATLKLVKEYIEKIQTGNNGSINCVELVKKSLLYMNEFDWFSEVYMIQPECIDEFADLITFCDDEELAVKTLGKIFTHIEYSRRFLNRMSYIKNHNDDKYAKMCELMSKVAGQYGYSYYVRIVAAYRAKRDEEVREIFMEMERDNVKWEKVDMELCRLRNKKNWI